MHQFDGSTHTYFALIPWDVLIEYVAPLLRPQPVQLLLPIVADHSSYTTPVIYQFCDRYYFDNSRKRVEQFLGCKIREQIPQTFVKQFLTIGNDPTASITSSKIKNNRLYMTLNHRQNFEFTILPDVISITARIEYDYSGFYHALIDRYYIILSQLDKSGTVTNYRSGTKTSRGWKLQNVTRMHCYA